MKVQLPAMAVLVFVLASNAAGQAVAENLSDLFQRLQITGQSDQAAQQLVQLAKSEKDVRTYIALNLPTVIEKNPHSFLAPWKNAVSIAGDLKIEEAMPALAKWVGEDNLGPNETTLGQIVHLETDPAAKALAKIGPPAIPTLTSILRGDKVSARKDAVLALRLIGSPEAFDAIRDQSTTEADPEVKGLIAQILSKHPPVHQ